MCIRAEWGPAGGQGGVRGTPSPGGWDQSRTRRGAVRNTILTSHWTCATGPARGSRLVAPGSARAWPAQGVPNQPRTSLYICPSALSTWDTLPTPSLLLSHYLLFKILFHAGFPGDCRGQHLWAARRELPGFLLSFVNSGPTAYPM